jgi:hypothetical protein
MTSDDLPVEMQAEAWAALCARQDAQREAALRAALRAKRALTAEHRYATDLSGMLVRFEGLPTARGKIEVWIRKHGEDGSADTAVVLAERQTKGQSPPWPLEPLLAVVLRVDADATRPEYLIDDEVVTLAQALNAAAHVVCHYAVALLDPAHEEIPF